MSDSSVEARRVRVEVGIFVVGEFLLILPMDPQSTIGSTQSSSHLVSARYEVSESPMPLEEAMGDIE